MKPHAAQEQVRVARRRSRARLRRGVAGCLAFAACVAVSGCSDPGEAYIETQNSIQTTLAGQHLAVASVSCTPHVGDLAWTDPPAHLHCVVRFKDGASYRTPATVQPVVDQPDALTWNGPPPGIGRIDITRAPLPGPTDILPAASTGSLFRATNLRPILATIEHRFAGQSVLRLVLYPGELQAVIAGAGDEARLVTASASGRLVVGPPSSFSGSRSAIYPSQLNPAVPQRLAALIAARGGVPTARLARFVLYFAGSNAGWEIYPVSGATRFEALLHGERPKVVSRSGVRPLG